ncbi:vitellin-degrading protease-like [Hermetia illucens]|uniref:vitellin-degrading protease-like n=1 Tax=Hermetia illucens TaxID=343691 RepID=UPI0018CC5F7D|nr:vitellin-degrading protease-like [Hermetia illucens]
MVRFLVFPLVALVIISFVSGAAVPKGLLPTYRYGRIIGGTPISIAEVPYMAQIVNYGAQYCGATIISNDAVVTAAHCLVGLIERWTKIRVGTNHRNSGTLLPIRKMVAHENFESVEKGNDVALIWLQEPLTFTSLIQKIPLVDPNTIVQPGQIALVTGWGYMMLNGYMPDQLMGVQVPIIDREECNADYEGIITEDMICAGYPEGQKDACSGDSGGPMVIKARLVGIVSFGYLCAQPGYPGVYTNVAHFANWVTMKVSEEAAVNSTSTVSVLS